MILDMILKLFDFIAGLLMKFISLPIFPSELASSFSFVIEWMAAGMGILNFFCPLDAIAPALATFIAVFTVVKLYRFVMWILTKIPVLGITD